MTNKQTELVKLVVIGQIRLWKFKFIAPELVAGSGEQDTKKVYERKHAILY